MLNIKGLKYEAQEDGSINFLDPRNDTLVWTMPKPFMYDASGEYSEAVTATLENNWGKLVLTVKADEEWVKSATRQFPVVIDPTLQPGPRDGRDTFISSKYHDKNYRARDLNYVGKTEAYGDTKSFFHFNVAPVEEDITVTSADFSIFAKQGVLSSINLYPVQFDWKWDVGYLTWDRWQSSGKIGTLIDSVTKTANEWWNFDVKTLVQQWVDNPTANLGLTLYPAGGSGYKEFYSCDYTGDAAKRPKLVYEYTTAPVPEPVPAKFKLHMDTRKDGKIKADGVAVADAKIYLSSDDGQAFTASADSSGKWEKTGMVFEKGKTRTISMYYEWEEERTDSEGNTYTVTMKSETTSQKFLIARYSWIFRCASAR